MRRLLFVSTLLAGLTLCSACNDDELSLEMTAYDLEQTVWNAHEIAYDGQGNIAGESFYVLEFQTHTTGKCTDQNADGDYLRTNPFSYTVDRKLVSFQGALTLQWTVHGADEAKNRHADLPRKQPRDDPDAEVLTPRGMARRPPPDAAFRRWKKTFRANDCFFRKYAYICTLKRFKYPFF